jgi:hypothetical protein
MAKIFLRFDRNRRWSLQPPSDPTRTPLEPPAVQNEQRESVRAYGCSPGCPGPLLVVSVVVTILINI